MSATFHICKDENIVKAAASFHEILGLFRGTAIDEHGDIAGTPTRSSSSCSPQLVTAMHPVTPPIA